MKQDETADYNVVMRLAEWLRKPGNLERFAQADHGSAAAARAEAAQIRQRMDELGESYAAGRVSIAVLEAAEAKLKPALADAEERAVRLAVPPMLERFTMYGDDARTFASVETIREMPLAAQRELLRAVATVRVYPKAMAASRDEQVQVEFRDPP